MLHGVAVSYALHSLQVHSQPAAPGRALYRRTTALQPAQRGRTLATTAGDEGEVGVAAGVCERAFFNRAAELQSLHDSLADAPTAVLVLSGPPSCGKSGAPSCALLVCPSP